MKKVNEQLSSDSEDISQFWTLFKLKSTLRSFLTCLLFLIFSLSSMAPTGPPLDKVKASAQIQEMKRERELNAFNKKLKEEYPDLFVLAMRESALSRDSVPNYKVYNKFGYLGAWQIHWKYLPSLGIYGVTMEDFIEDPDNTFPFEVQLQAIETLIGQNKKYLGWYLEYYPGKHAQGVNITEEGMLYAAHLGGAGGLKKFLRTGHNPSDAFGKIGRASCRERVLS